MCKKPSSVSYVIPCPSDMQDIKKLKGEYFEKDLQMVLYMYLQVDAVVDPLCTT